MLFFLRCQTEITVEFQPVSEGMFSYVLQWKEHSQTWESSSGSKSVELGDAGKKCKTTAEDLKPGTTYCVRLVIEDGNGQKGEPGPELILDTEQVGCTPKQSKSCCVVQ